MKEQVNEQQKKVGKRLFARIYSAIVVSILLLILPNMTVHAEEKSVTISGSGELTFEEVRDKIGDATEVVVEGYESIGGVAFSGCSNLTKVTFSDSVTQINYQAFQGCSGLTSIHIPGNVTDIGYASFAGCTELKSITFSEGVQYIGGLAFSGCSKLEKVIIPKSVTSMGEYVFENCNELKTAGPVGGEYNIEFGWRDSIAFQAFHGCSSLTSVTLPYGLKSLPYKAFYECTGLTSVNLPQSVQSLDGSTFRECSNLNSIVLSKSLSFIGANTFEGCISLNEITIPNQVTFIGESAFSGCKKLNQVVIPDSVKEINNRAFAECTELRDIKIPHTVDMMGEEVFAGCGNVSVSGYTGSIAEETANREGIPFHSLGTCKKINFDGSREDLYVDDFQYVTSCMYIVNEPYGKFPDFHSVSEDIILEGWYLEPTYQTRITESDIYAGDDIVLYAKSMYTKERDTGFIKGEDSKYYWYEGRVKQGTYDDPKGVIGDGTVRGREIFDPESDGWYWLDACYGGAKACNKEVWMPYIYQNEKNWDDAEIEANANNSGSMKQQVIEYINKGYGKWVRYDSFGKMIKGWYTVDGDDEDIYPTQVGNTYYYDYQTGLMAKGWQTIDGVEYYFDETTGVLQ